MKCVVLCCAAGLALAARGYNPAEGTVTVTVDPSVARGAIRAVNGVNNGPCTPMAGQNMGYYEKTFADAKIPFARTHDSSFVEAYGVEHVVDVSALFPDFDADETKAENYDFSCTDAYLKGLIAAGTEPYFRLGQRIELQRGGKKYHLRPKDFAKWARICEHVIAHYTEGWAGGYKWNVRYWEIWNEPDNNVASDPECWQGTDEEFYGFFVIAQTHLKTRFPHLRIGGPGLAGGGRDGWTKGFFEYLKAKNVKLDLDFYSWHSYTTDPRAMMRNARMNRAVFDAYGYTNTESHVTEWNYVKGFNLGWDYTLRVERGDLQDKGAAFIAACLSQLQDAPVDVATFYDAAPSVMNSLYDQLYNPIRGYYPFFAWGKLRDLGTQVSAAVTAKSAAKKDTADDMYVTAAKGPDGRLGVLVVRYNDDNNVVLCKQVDIRLRTGSLAGARCFLTDRNTLFTERPAHVRADGSLWLVMEPNSFVWIETGPGACVPALMTCADGSAVDSVEKWEQVRRPELLRTFLKKVYGVRPVERPADLAFEVVRTDETALGGRAVRKDVRISFGGVGGRTNFLAVAMIPKAKRPVPTFLVCCNRDPKKSVKTRFWDMEGTVARGYASVGFYMSDVVPDLSNAPGYWDDKEHSRYRAAFNREGVFAALEKPGTRTDESWGTISAWAWAASRVMDWIETEPLVDAQHVAVIGHSRGGKTALLAAVTDTRFAMACVNDSGCTGAKLNHMDLPASEHVAQINAMFPDWFCGAYKAYDGREAEMPFDQHEWLALMAPRLLAVASASEDRWAGPPGEFAAARLASPAWELYGKRGLVSPPEFPEVNTAWQDGCVSYHLRKGAHDMTPWDWARYMDFADRHGWRPAPGPF